MAKTTKKAVAKAAKKAAKKTAANKAKKVAAKPKAAKTSVAKKGVVASKTTKKKSAGKKASARKKERPGARQVLTAQARHELIAQAAYLRSESQGFMGDAAQDWTAAEAEIDERLAKAGIRIK